MSNKQPKETDADKLLKKLEEKQAALINLVEQAQIRLIVRDLSNGTMLKQVLLYLELHQSNMIKVALQMEKKALWYFSRKMEKLIMWEFVMEMEI